MNLIIEIDDSVPLIIYSDCKRYKQVLFNLLGNACKFTFRGNIKLRLTFLDNQLKTYVIDTGIGIQAEDLKKLFKFFGKL